MRLWSGPPAPLEPAEIPPLVLAALALAPAPLGGPVVRPESGLAPHRRVPGGLACPVAFAEGRFGFVSLPCPVLHPLLVGAVARREGRTPVHTSRVYQERGGAGLAWPFALEVLPVVPPEWREAGAPFHGSTGLYARVVARVQRMAKATAMDLPDSFLAMERWELGRAVMELFAGLPPDEDGSPRNGLLPASLVWLERAGLPTSEEALVAAAVGA